MDEQVVRWPQQSVSAANRHDVSSASQTDLSKLSDTELMVRLRQGEHEALSHLFDRYHRLTLSIAVRIVRDAGEAEDLMQEVFLAIYRVVDRFDPAKGTVKNWIAQFTYHKALNRRKYLALRGAFQDPHIREFDPAESAYSPRDDCHHTPSDIIAIVRQGMATLTAKQREVVELACFEGYLFREISERTNESLENVRHYYYRGIGKLKEFVKTKLDAGEAGRAAARGGEK